MTTPPPPPPTPAQESGATTLVPIVPVTLPTSGKVTTFRMDNAGLMALEDALDPYMVKWRAEVEDRAAERGVEPWPGTAGKGGKRPGSVWDCVEQLVDRYPARVTLTMAQQALAHDPEAREALTLADVKATEVLAALLGALGRALGVDVKAVQDSVREFADERAQGAPDGEQATEDPTTPEG